ncbi:unnamed protein product [Heterosigma akashiwo]|uniref:3-oxoacyl-[acyl-carrier-protein] reductase n=1 Tax=Heterosigma akashiwo TaxID=2829 RepID=A0A6V1W200_HETAK|mmetsp:Transcript_14706/g.20328  ORF Transcript_14706/g.20328 Transcript_14706/m.20328 type:complete len:275 (+) Transcript_14706:90-914(+)
MFSRFLFLLFVVLLAAVAGFQLRMSAAGKPALVTGSATGIGRQIAHQLAKEGCNLVINYPFEGLKEAADAVVQECKDLGADAIAVEADVTKPDQVADMMKTIASTWDEPLYICVNNAGITKDSLALRMKPADWQAVIDVNLSGVFYCAQASAKVMTKARAGRIVNIASVVGQIGNVGQANYSASKGGVIALTKTLAKEFGGRGVTVNAVCPGFIETPMTKDLPGVDQLLAAIPLGRFGQPEEVAGMVRFLCTDDASGYMTGHMFDVDGGIGIGV